MVSTACLPLAAVALTACAAQGATTVPTRVVVSHGRQLNIIKVSAVTGGSTVIVRGQVARGAAIPGPVRSHLHVEAWAGGRLLVRKDARWLQLSKHMLPTSRFRAELPIEPFGVDEIRITHVAASHATRANQEFVHD